MKLNRETVWECIRYPFAFKWEVQGFGMLRTYLNESRKIRLQIWDQRLAVWGNGAIHDHPWDFESTIIAGVLYNQRYAYSSSFEKHGKQFHFQRIVPGKDGGPEGDVGTVYLKPKPIEVYMVGEKYSQIGREFHRSRYQNGTVTLLERSNRQKDDRALSIWEPNGEPWVFFRPRPATDDEVRAVVGKCIENWYPFQ